MKNLCYSFMFFITLNRRYIYFSLFYFCTSCSFPLFLSYRALNMESETVHLSQSVCSSALSDVCPSNGCCFPNPASTCCVCLCPIIWQWSKQTQHTAEGTITMVTQGDDDSICGSPGNTTCQQACLRGSMHVPNSWGTRQDWTNTLTSAYTRQKHHHYYKHMGHGEPDFLSSFECCKRKLKG